METATPDTQPMLRAAGFWRRVFAFVIDGFLIGLVGFVLGLVLYDTLAQLGVWGRLVGFAIALPYFGLMNSRLAGGQTFGKRWLGIRAQGVDGSLLSVPRAFARYGLLAVPFFLNGAPLPIQFVTGAWAYLTSFLVFGLGLSILYLFVFNRTTRRSLHDYLVGSWVVPAATSRADATPMPLWRGHVATVAVLVLVSLSLPLAAQRISRAAVFADLMPAYGAVNAEPGVENAVVNIGWARNNGVEVTYTALAAQLSSPKVEDEMLARRLALRAVAASPSLAKRDLMQVTLSYGFDLGIANAWRSFRFQFDPAELAEAKASTGASR